jgi:hypothetical protein
MLLATIGTPTLGERRCGMTHPFLLHFVSSSDLRVRPSFLLARRLALRLDPFPL